MYTDTILPFLDNHLIPVAAIVIAAYVAVNIVMIFVSRIVRRTIRTAKYKSKKDEQQREDTIIVILSTALRVVIWTIALLMILGEFGVNIGPLLAGAGVAGVALGFGAQSMVKDFLAGVFIIAENQYRVGDVLQVNQTVAGIVEKVSLRSTVLRDLNGMVHYVPNGFIDIATNMTMEYASVDINISVSYDSDIEKVERVINQVGESIAADPAWNEVVLEAPHMFRVEDFAEYAIIVKVVGKTAPIQQWNVKSEILKRLKIAFDKEGIVIPFPQQVIHTQPTTK